MKFFYYLVLVSVVSLYAKGLKVDGFEVGAQYSFINTVNASRLGEEDGANRLHFRSGLQDISRSNYAYTRVDAIDFLSSTFTPEDENGGTYYAPSLNENPLLHVSMWDFLEIGGAGAILNYDSVFTWLIGVQGAISHIGIDNKGRDYTGAQSVLRYGLNTGFSTENEFLMAMAIINMDWMYIMTGEYEDRINGKILGGELIVFPKSLSHLNNMHFRVFSRTIYDFPFEDFVLNTNANSLTSLNTDPLSISEIGMSVSIVLFAN